MRPKLYPIWTNQHSLNFLLREKSPSHKGTIEAATQHCPFKRATRNTARYVSGTVANFLLFQESLRNATHHAVYQQETYNRSCSLFTKHHHVNTCRLLVRLHALHWFRRRQHYGNKSVVRDRIVLFVLRQETRIYLQTSVYYCGRGKGKDVICACHEDIYWKYRSVAPFITMLGTIWRSRMYIAYANDVLILGWSVRATEEVVTQIKEATVSTGLVINVRKTTYMKINRNTVERRLSERQSSETSNIRTHIFFVLRSNNEKSAITSLKKVLCLFY